MTGLGQNCRNRLNNDRTTACRVTIGKSSDDPQRSDNQQRSNDRTKAPKFQHFCARRVSCLVIQIPNDEFAHGNSTKLLKIIFLSTTLTHDVGPQAQ
jgi:hypothetical protein